MQRIFSFSPRHIGLAAFPFLLCVGTSHAQPRRVAVLKAQAARIDRNLKRYGRVERDLPGRSTEGGNLTFYSLGSSPRKLFAQYFGESGKATEEFYFRNNSLFRMRRRNSTYDKLYGKVVATEETNFYFNGGKLLPGSSKAETPYSAREILEDARDLLRLSKRK
ncbi:MAG TPA: hypothetical protein VF681_08285 [Abditibacteriaceae bacterium]|jgi:hypothetical protein